MDSAEQETKNWGIESWKGTYKDKGGSKGETLVFCVDKKSARLVRLRVHVSLSKSIFQNII